MTISVIRSATPADYAEIWRLFLQGHRENGIFTLDTKKVEYFLNRALFPEKIHPQDTGPRGQIGVIGSPGRLEAIAFMIIGQFWYSSDYHLEELLVFVDPEHRKTEHAKNIIAWMKMTADKLGIRLLCGIMSTDRTDAKMRLYDRYLPRIGGFFLYPITDTIAKRKNHNMDKQSLLDATT